MSTTQLSLLKDHLKSGRSITPLEALGLYGVFRLAARIKELRYKGWDIATEIRRDIKGHVYSTYSLAPQADHGLPPFAHAPSQLNPAA